jgi:hypothetical protein
MLIEGPITIVMNHIERIEIRHIQAEPGIGAPGLIGIM